MFRTLLTTTAIAALLSTGAMAQDTTTPAPEAPAMDAPAMDAPAADAPTTMEAPAADTTEAAPAVAPTSLLATGYTVTDKDNLATEIIGKQVYSSTAADAEHIGDVNNLVIGDGSEVAAVVIGVGGFLGIGQKNVAVLYSELEWVTAEDGTERFVLPTTKEALEAAPDFEAIDESAGEGAVTAPADGGAMAPADQPADAMTPATDPAAPATTTP